ncbi:MAG: putative toluene tolerance protein [bacterium]|nr:MAG: putative toluene tolerance protein [bacterium]KAF0149974.1 MAG: putative toluene tolerance protein [bacterium]KAF0169082.1 MAG: putative toluene tolerance protein [bacterium]TXT21511.1 MAG: putative toluene tolerance protein [bacterium]
MNRASRLFLAAALGLMTVATQAQALAPDALARNTTNEVLSILKQDKELRNGNSRKILALVEQKILPNFDFRQMTQLAVGRNWSKASPEQQERLVEEFKTLLVRTYSASLTSVLDYKIEFLPLRMAPGASEVTVNTVVSKSGAPPLPIDYRMERQDNAWKVFDVLVEGVSLVTVYRNSFTSEVRKGGIDGLVATLSRRNQQQAAVAGP